MYIRKTKKSKSKKNYYQHQLIKSVRTPAGPRQEIVLNMKQLDLPQDRWKELANAIEEKLLNQRGLFIYDSEIEALAEHYTTLIVNNEMNKQSDEDVIEEEKQHDYETVDLNSMKQTNDKSYGGEKVISNIMDEYKFGEILQEQGFSENQIKSTKMLIGGRILHPSSERETARWLNENSSLPEFVKQNSTINDNTLHRAAKLLWKNHESIEDQLADKAKNIFSLHEKVILYDLTNTYFEGSKRNSQIAKRGNSKEKRSDCPLITLALTVDEEGFPKSSKTYEGNIGEGSTLETVLKQYETDKPGERTIVLDAGIASEDNLNLIKNSPYNLNYVAVSKKQSYPDDYWKTGKEVRIKLKDKQTTLKIKSERTDDEVFLLCHSEAKEKKEQGIIERRQEQFEKELQSLNDGFHKKRNLKNYDTVREKIGRLKEKYKVGHLYDIKVKREKDSKGKENATELSFKRNDNSDDKKSNFGNYVLRTNRIDLSDQEITQIHRSLTTVEDSFRSMKSHLGMRPIHHKTDTNSEAHIYVTVIAYHFVIATIKKLRSKGINYNWNSIREALVSHRRVTTTFTTKDDRVINIRQNGEPNKKQTGIYAALKLKFGKGLQRVKVMLNKK